MNTLVPLVGQGKISLWLPLQIQNGCGQSAIPHKNGRKKKKALS
jgi:hypothetical protein